MSQGTHWHGCHTAHLDCAIAKIERLEAELKTEQALSFRNQVATLEAERDAARQVAEETTQAALDTVASHVQAIRQRDAAVARYEYLRRLNVPQFQDLFVRCLKGERFDDMVDAAIDAARGEA